MKILQACFWLAIFGLMILAGCDNGLDQTFSVQENKDTVSSNTSENGNDSATNGNNTSETTNPDNEIDHPDVSDDKTDDDTNEESSGTEGTTEDGIENEDTSTDVVVKPNHRSYASSNIMDDPLVHEVSLRPKYDARGEDLVTSVKYQNDPICWAYATASIIETAMIKKELTTKDDVNISEYTLAYYKHNSVKTPIGGLDTDSRDGKGTALKGDAPSAMANILCAWNGVVNDCTNSIATISDVNRDEAYKNQAALVTTACPILTNAGCEDIEDAIQKMKKAIVAYGSIAISYYESHSNYSESSGRYQGDYAGANHAVTVVGWDDDFSDFVNTPPENGAWLVKNSYGDSWENKGYFWLSYYDATIGAKAFYVDVVTNDTYDNNYQYDDASPKDSFISSYGSSQVLEAANVYTTQGEHEELMAVQFGMAYDGMSYKISIYRDLIDPKNPTSGEYEVEVIGGQLPMGRHTINLPHTIQLKKDETFSVIVTFTTSTPGQNPSVEYEDNENSLEGQSFYRRNLNDGWVDVNDEGKGNIRIKAFTKNL